MVDCKKMGFSSAECKCAGFSAADCKEAGFSFADCREAGFCDHCSISCMGDQEPQALAMKKKGREEEGNSNMGKMKREVCLPAACSQP